MKTYPLFLISLLLALNNVITDQTPSNLRDVHQVFLNETFYTGYLPIGTKGSSFYWLFESRLNPKEDPLVIWITEGSRCSSEIAIFFENGPYKINQDLSLRSNPYSWNNIANVLYVTIPSKNDNSQTETEESNIDEDFFSFLVEFLRLYPSYRERELYLAGESFSTYVIPKIAAHIFKQNNNDIQLAGVSIGNGWIEPKRQIRSNAKFAYYRGLITNEELTLFDKEYLACQKLFDQDNFEIAELSCLQTNNELIGEPAKFNYYDVRTPCISPELCYDFTWAQEFLNRNDVRMIIDNTQGLWTECNSRAYEPFEVRGLKSQANNVADLLELGVPILVYYGDMDLVCNYIGGEEWVKTLEWSGNDFFDKLTFTSFASYGQYKTYKGLTFLQVFNAGNMVSMDQPGAALTILEKLIEGFNFLNYYDDEM